ncbi:MAG: dihydrolipoyl dehydrogenase [Nitrososphaeria archaeon]
MLASYKHFPPTHDSFTDPPSSDSYDVLIIGGGGGGYHGGFQLSDSRKRALLVDDKGNLGGNCLYEGCIPSKAVYMTIYLTEKVKNIAEHPGAISVNMVKDIWEKAVEHKDWVQEIRYQQHIREILEHENLEFVKAIARPLGCCEAEIVSADGSWRKRVRSKYMIVATGSVPVRPPISGAELTIGSEDLFGYRTDYRKPGRSFIIIGGGYIGVELASALSRISTDVTIVEMLPNILSGWDQDAVAEIRSVLEEKGVKIMTNSRVVSIEKEGGQKRVVYQDPAGNTRNAVADEVVMAVGRVPYVEGLEPIGLKIDRGKVVTDSHMRTSVDRVYAAGDVLGKYMLFHAAVKGSVIAAWNIAAERPLYEMNFRSVPVSVFTEPEMASVGITPGEAERLGIPYTTVSYPLEDDAYAQIMKMRKGWVKITVERETQRVIGGLIVGEAASLIINEIALAVAVNARIKDLGVLAHQHPTIFEAIDRAAIKCCTV